jgi:hypothetical protein
MRYAGRLLLSIGAFLVTFLPLGFVLGWTTGGFDLGGSHPSEAQFLLSFLLFPVTPIMIGYLCAAGVWRLFCRPTTVPKRARWRRLVVRFAIVAYLFTWAFGVPAVQTSLDTDAVEAYKHMREQFPEKVREGHPYMKSYVSLPVLPGLIVTYHEHQCAVLAGFGGWRLHLWWLTGVTEVFCLQSWIS